MSKTSRSVLFTITVLLSAGFILPQSAQAHCQIPCGIYDDYARLLSMLEDTATIEKSVNMMIELTGKMDVQSQNQMVRWVMNKEDHAQRVIDTISDYYLTQRVKPSQKDYGERLKHHHAVILAAMKAKQNADLATVKKLKKSIDLLAKYYPEHKH
ncbi:MAG: superoxide dismutase [Deltaproteobacteria bacterium]|jgi:nickel superoxide dismutase|nr:superoxide dismutase [Candidatus Neomarinimicrobiota bacterium]MBT7888364.1 superoxide dismutase [Deltaproteobacteria bacterium]MBT4362505.1 superoxide dismutase [Candidatus Neomarinimicrobiota bacterium]MBT4714493.1 superoxide dismutase [Candidatus Neomarinimicrobiota bacterium]MBT4946532.1 superoxide dismutase [Candidatus Neomarinimicrobiota bacterium]